MSAPRERGPGPGGAEGAEGAEGRTMRLVVVTGPRLVAGFRLAGADTVAAETGEEAARAIQRLLAEGERGVIAVSAPLFEALPGALRARLEASLRPVVLPIPDGLRATPAEERRARFAELLERAVGFHLVFEGGT